MIENLSLKFGAARDRTPVSLNVAPVTVFVGPNHSGKSKVLQELNRFCMSGLEHPTDVILGSLTFQAFPPEQVPVVTQSLRRRARASDTVKPGHIFIGKHQVRHQVPETEFEAALRNPNERKRNFCRWYLALHVLMLDGKSRISLVDEQKATDLQKPPQNVLDILYRENEKRREVRRMVYEAFGVHFVIDPTNLGKLRIRLSSEPPNDEIQERGIHADAVEFHGKALGIDEASDGVKAFTGIVTQITAGDPNVILIDEPEAFLHPALSFKLGKEVAVAAASSAKRLFVSTHSANFVMGCIQSGAPINIVRLTYQDGVATARTLPQEKLLKLMRNPLLRSTGVLEGLFYESVVVTEADSDRAFYQEVNERLVREGRGRGIPNCLFLNAQNKQTIHQIIRPLRDLGIPAAGAVDVDVLEEGGQNWSAFMKGGSIPEVTRAGLGPTRAKIQARCQEKYLNMKRNGGIAVLPDEDREAAENVLAQLAEYGLFVVDRGELESWLPHLGATGHGPGWLVDVFERMGEDPDDDAYLAPGDGDVWEFMEQIGRWLKNPDRKGIPIGPRTRVVGGKK